MVASGFILSLDFFNSTSFFSRIFVYILVIVNRSLCKSTFFFPLLFLWASSLVTIMRYSPILLLFTLVCMSIRMYMGFFILFSKMISFLPPVHEQLSTLFCWSSLFLLLEISLNETFTLYYNIRCINFLSMIQPTPLLLYFFH